MGEAKRRAEAEKRLVWHHTSILRTNLIWMSGVIEVEGKSEGALHPGLGKVLNDATMRRNLCDFPALAWFSSSFEVPHCLRQIGMMGVARGSGEMERLTPSPDDVATLVMNRIALGFDPVRSRLMRWNEHPGYDTEEGCDLNESAREVGDDPDEWWVSGTPVDAAEIVAIRGARSFKSFKMERMDNYLPDAKRMIALCRAIPGTYIPPSWVGSDFHRATMKAGSVHPDCRQFDELVNTARREPGQGTALRGLLRG